MNRSLCQRGCPFGGYFSSNSSTLPWAAKTGNLTLRPHAVVHSVLYDDSKEKATGVRVINAESQETIEFYAPLIFVNASALNTNALLLNSVSKSLSPGPGQRQRAAG